VRLAFYVEQVVGVIEEIVNTIQKTDTRKRAMIIEKWWRSWLKTLSWRVVATLTLSAITLIATGSLVLAGTIVGLDIIIKSIVYYIHERLWSSTTVGQELKEYNGCVVWFTGLSGSGKTTLADEVARQLRRKIIPVKRLDGDVARATFSSDLGFTKEDRDENNKRAAHAASWGSQDSIVLSSFISPYKQQRDYVKGICKNYIEVFVKCPIKVCEERDVKGLYKKVREGKIKSFTGIHSDAPYEEPLNPDEVIFTDVESLKQSAKKVVALLKRRGLV